MIVEEYGIQNQDVSLLLHSLRHGDLNLNHRSQYARILRELMGEYICGQ